MYDTSVGENTAYDTIMHSICSKTGGYPA